MRSHRMDFCDHGDWGNRPQQAFAPLGTQRHRLPVCFSGKHPLLSEVYYANVILLPRIAAGLGRTDSGQYGIRIL